MHKLLMVTDDMDERIKWAVEEGWAISEGELIRGALDKFLPTTEQIVKRRADKGGKK